MSGFSVSHRRKSSSIHLPYWFKQLGLVVGGIIAVMVGMFFITSRFIFQTKASPYQGIIFYGDPVTIVMHDTVAKKTATFTLPASVVLETKQYGSLSLASLWKLGIIEKKHGSILLQSLSDAMGIPLSWYIGQKEGSLKLADLSDFGSLFTFSRGGYETNMQLLSFIQVWNIIRSIDIFFSPSVAIDSLTVVANKQLSDGATVQVLDTGRLDILLGDKRELTTVRKEQLTVTIINASGKVGAGQKVGRLVSNIGARVAAVSTDTVEESICELVGTTQSLQSVTSTILLGYWGCKVKEVSAFERSDLTLRIGTQFAL